MIRKSLAILAASLWLSTAFAATVTEEAATADTTTTPNTSAAFTPAVDDLLIIVASCTATAEVPVLATSSVSGNTFTYVTGSSSAYPGTLDNKLQFFVADQLIASGEDVSQTVTINHTADSCTGTNIHVLAVAGMERVGLDAILQVGTPDDDNGSGATPTVVFGANVLTGNVTIGAVQTNVEAISVTEPSGWTAGTAIGFASPNAGQEIVWRNSGFTGTTITWGGTFGGAGSANAIELDTSSPSSPPAFDTGIACSAVDANSISCTYDADATADRIFLCAKAKGASAPADGAAVEAGTGCSGTATENTTGSSDSLQIDFAGDPLAEQDIWAVLEEGTSNYSSLSSDLVTRFTAPTGYQYLNKSGAPTPPEIGILDGASPAAVDGDTMQVSTHADSYALGPAANAVTLNPNTTYSVATGGDVSRQIIYRRFSDYSLPAWSDGSPVAYAINNLKPIWLGDLIYTFAIDEAVSVFGDSEWLDLEGDAMTHAFANLPTGMTGDTEEITGAPTTCGVYATVSFTATDAYGDDDVQVVTFNIGNYVPDVIGDDEATAVAAIEADSCLVAVAGTARYDSVIPLGDVIETTPEFGDEVQPFGTEVEYILSLGELAEYDIINGRATLADGTWVTIALADGVAVPGTAVVVNGTAIEPDGRGYLADCPDAEDIAAFISGTAVRVDGAVCVTTNAPDQIVNGLGHSTRGELSVTLDAPEFIINGRGLNAQGVVSVTDVP